MNSLSFVIEILKVRISQFEKQLFKIQLVIIWPIG